MERENQEIDQLTWLKAKVEHQEQMLMEAKKAIQETWNIIETAQNPYLFGNKRSRWSYDRQRLMETLKRIELKIRTRTHF